MPQLRHLIILGDYNCYFNNLISAPVGLNNLQTLVGKVRNVTSFLHMIPNLRKLSLSYSRGSGEFFFDNLVKLHQLEKLKLEIEGHWVDYGFPKLVLPTSLKKLALIGWGSSNTYLGPNIPYLDIPSPLPNLQVLKLRKFNFRKQPWVTRDEDFPNLRFLLIDQSNIHHNWKTEDSPFPLLESLLIHSCRNLHKIPDSIAEIPTLKLIEVKDCEYSLADFIKQMQENQQEDCGDDVFEVRSIGCGPKSYQIGEEKVPATHEKIQEGSIFHGFGMI
ncbi:putative late blight resistance protein homolog R1B-16 isoform X2 [Salvia miltiorrhiza]|uniref:putative late blight resistance protein homolog R1B-16 isoform X2 n=1 Tax=Salvia miltiorrhiza TaxID=226208 RepID=UPI0025AD4960|nr:putative late blight resistance protein homolog R1B-16 isoform X2 [Salvia miltiorrhiza]